MCEWNEFVWWYLRNDMQKKGGWMVNKEVTKTRRIFESRDLFSACVDIPDMQSVLQYKMYGIYASATLLSILTHTNTHTLSLCIMQIDNIYIRAYTFSKALNWIECYSSPQRSSQRVSDAIDFNVCVGVLHYLYIAVRQTTLRSEQDLWSGNVYIFSLCSLPCLSDGSHAGIFICLVINWQRNKMAIVLKFNAMGIMCGLRTMALLYIYDPNLLNAEGNMVILRCFFLLYVFPHE